MIEAYAADVMLASVFLDASSPFSLSGFALSLHTDTVASGAAEIAATSYTRALIGHGPSFWYPGAKSMTNRIELRFPILAYDTEVWRSVRSVGLWSLDTGVPLWPLPVDAGAVTVTYPDLAVIPAGGLVYRIG